MDAKEVGPVRVAIMESINFAEDSFPAISGSGPKNSNSRNSRISTMGERKESMFLDR